MSSANPLSSFLYWIGGTADELVVQCSPWVQRLYITLGLVFVCNFVFLSCAWIKVFSNYFGWLGILPGLVIPAVFVLGIDRLMAQRPRRLTGSLERYELHAGRSVMEIALRISISFALSVTSTFTLLLNLSQDLIREQAQTDARLANAALRQEYVDSIASLFGPEFELLKGQESTLLQNRLYAQKELERSVADEAAAASAARDARQEQFAEAGGLDVNGRQRSVGIGPRYLAQREIADMNDALAAAARETRERVEARLESLERDLSVVRTAITDAQRQRQQSLDEVNSAIVADMRYVREKADLFSDTVLFLRLFTDPQRASGVTLVTMDIFMFLVTLELAAILALYLLPQTQYDVLKNTSIVQQSARVASISGMEDINAELWTYRTYTPGASDMFERDMRLQEEKMLRARLDVLNIQLRSSYAQDSATLDVRLPGLKTVDVRAGMFEENLASSPERPQSDDESRAA